MGCMKGGCIAIVALFILGVVSTMVMEANLTPEERAERTERLDQVAIEKAQRDATRKAAEAEANRPITISPAQLVRDYDGNEVAADLIYKGRRLRITGAVDDIGKDILDNIYVTLESGHVVRKVQVMFDDKYTNQIAGLRKGAQITIVGRCQGLMMNVLIGDASIE